MQQKRIPIKRNSTSHIALCMMKVARTPVTFQHFREMNSLRFKKRSPSDLKPLIEMGFVTFDGEKYTITEAGISAVYTIAGQQTRPNPAD